MERFLIMLIFVASITSFASGLIIGKHFIEKEVVYMYNEVIQNTAKLDTGEIVPYDATHSSKDNTYSDKVFRYIGEGVIHTVNGVHQSGTTKDHFYVYKRTKNGVLLKPRM